jgi:hypothetical protein
VIDKNQKTWICKVCQEPVASSASSTGNLWFHLKKHRIFSPRAKVTQSKLTPDLVGKALSKTVVEKANYHLAKVIVNDMRTLSLQVSDSFIAFAKALSPLYDPPGEETMGKMLKDYHVNKAQPALKAELTLVPSFSMTTDGWKVQSGRESNYRYLDISRYEDFHI